MNKSHFDVSKKSSDEGEEPEPTIVRKTKKKSKTSKQDDDDDEDADDENPEEIEPEGEHLFEHESVEEEQLPKFETVVLKREEISARLSMLGKTGDGDGYAYLKAACMDMALTDIKSLTFFKYLQCVNLNKNNLQTKDLQVLGELPFLVYIQADYNPIRSAKLPKMKYLQIIVMNYTNINTVFDIHQPELSTLELGYNHLIKITFEIKLPMLRCIDFRYNSIHDMNDFNFEMLDSLYLAGNRLRKLNGVSQMVNLRILHLRNNPIKLLTGFAATMTKLKYLNLRNCKVRTLIQVKKLRVLPALETLVMKGCPYMGGTGNEEDVQEEEDDQETRVEMIASLPKIQRINKTPVGPEEAAEAKELMMQWLEEGENDEEERAEEEGLEETKEGVGGV